MSQQERKRCREDRDHGASWNGIPEDCPCLLALDGGNRELPQNPDAWAAVLTKRWHQHDWERSPMIPVINQIRLHAVGTFLLGLGSTHSDIWIEALVDAKMLDSEERASSTKTMTERYTAMVEIFTTTFDAHLRVFFPEKEQLMKDMLKLIFVVEREFFPRGKICVEEALHMSMAFPFFHDECDRLSVLTKEPWYKYKLKECDLQAVQFGALFFCKLVQAHVYHAAFYITPLTNVMAFKLRGRDVEDPADLKTRGNLFYKKGDYKAAIDKYTQAMKTDFFNCHLYGNRAQCYINLKRYRDALCDCRRALFVNPKWYKGSYRAAEACLKLGDRWEEARRFIEKSLSDIRSSHNPDQDLVMQIEDLRKQILDYIGDKRSETRRDGEDSAGRTEQTQDQPTSEDGAGKARAEGHAGQSTSNFSVPPREVADEEIREQFLSSA